jgi:hypothetical protein
MPTLGTETSNFKEDSPGTMFGIHRSQCRLIPVEETWTQR